MSQQTVSKEDFSIVWDNLLNSEDKVKELKEEIKDLEEENTEFENERNVYIDKVDNLLYENDELEGQVADLEEKVDRKKDKINTLKEENEKLRENMTGILDTIYSDEGPRLLDLLGDIGDIVEKVDTLNTLKEENKNLTKTLEDYEHWRDECEDLKDENNTLKQALKDKEEENETLDDLIKEKIDELQEENKKLKEEKLNLYTVSMVEEIIASNEEEKFQADLKSGKIPHSCGVKTKEEVESSSEEEEENEEDLYECLYCGQSGNPYEGEWVSERCRKNDEDKVYVDHPECDYKGQICNGCKWYGEQMCYKCRPLNGEPKSLYYPDTEEEEVEIVELKSKEDINMDKQKKKLASALSRLNSIKKICVSDNGNFQEVQFIMEEHSGKGDLISQKHSENEIRLAKIDKEYQEYQLFLETPHTTSNDFNNALGVYVSKINKILEEQIVNNYSAEELYPNL